jgi:hypothetical protein
MNAREAFIKIENNSDIFKNINKYINFKYINYINIYINISILKDPTPNNISKEINNKIEIFLN